MGITPQQAFEAIKVLNPEIVTLHPKHPQWESDHWVHGNGLRVSFRCSVGIDWPEGVTQWPMPEKKWRKATVNDVDPKNPKVCRFREKNYGYGSDGWGEWIFCHLIYVNSVFLGLRNGHDFKMFDDCEIEVTELDSATVEGMDELIADKEKRMQIQLSADKPMETAPQEKTILLKLYDGSYVSGYWSIVNHQWVVPFLPKFKSTPIAWRSL